MAVNNICLQVEGIEFYLIRSRRKSLGLYIKDNGDVVVRAPMRASLKSIYEFVAKHKQWILRNKKELEQCERVRHFVDGEKFLFLGEEFPLRIVDNENNGLYFSGKEFLLPRSLAQKGAEVFERWYKDVAKDILIMRGFDLAHQLNLSPKDIRLTSARSFWGSCNSNGIVRISWRLIMAPQYVIDYIIIHELSHLKVRGHSPYFWACVRRRCPDYEKATYWLKKHGTCLGIIG